ncbi:MAG: cell division protein SepF [Candidatus Thermoplasmatota archaeon]
MGLAKKIFGDKKSDLTEGYVDLEKYVDSTGDSMGSVKMKVALGEIRQYDDLKVLSDYVYGGNVLILDFSAIADEEVILKRVTNELKRITDDIGGDIAGIGNNLMIVSPSGVKVDRRKIRGTNA